MEQIKKISIREHLAIILMGFFFGQLLWYLLPEWESTHRLLLAIAIGTPLIFIRQWHVNKKNSRKTR